MGKSKLKIYAYYLPQFHETQENNIWWGKGFTEWDNVRKALPLYPGHYQPRVPSSGNYYDLSKPEAIAAQAALAKSYGINGFGIYHYWYSGVRLLSSPIDIILANKWIDTSFYLCWANHSWTRCWKNSSAASDMLIRQSYESHSSERENHYRYLAKAMSDARYVTLDGKYLLQIYQPASIPGFSVFVDELREYILRETNHEIHISGLISHNPSNYDFLSSIDSITLFQPGTSIYNSSDLSDSIKLRELGSWFSSFVRNIPDPLKKVAYKLQGMKKERPTFLDYSEHWDKIIAQTQCLKYKGKDLIPGAFVDFDNTARYKNRAKIFTGVSPEVFEHYFRKLAHLVNGQCENKLILINAWNEWGEGAYLEPDARNGHAYLEAVRNSINDVK
ncbi:MAG: glycoside hydrolase family 99-like domain-containing protein [Elusimicrobiales bacterium]|nr:glycoside hydrolase family 99-like domain-containing protein [Elusimicrobiales bacterium]